MAKPTVGFIGQGFIGKAYADDIEERGFDVVRYTRSEPYVKNREKIATCDYVFIAVPTPTVPLRSSKSEGGPPSTTFDSSVVEEVLSLVGKGNVAVIKSTVLPGTTDELQEKFSDIFVIHNPEFLRAKTAVEDAKNPERTVIGLPKDTSEYREHAEQLLKILPKAPIDITCTAKEAELIKYASNNFLHVKLVYFNLIHDLSKALGADYETVRRGVVTDPRIGDSHTRISHDGGRGAGGFCLIKDFAALREIYEKVLKNDKKGQAVLTALEEKNIELLRESGKDLDLLKGVYGE